MLMTFRTAIQLQVHAMLAQSSLPLIGQIDSTLATLSASFQPQYTAVASLTPFTKASLLIASRPAFPEQAHSRPRDIHRPYQQQQEC